MIFSLNTHEDESSNAACQLVRPSRVPVHTVPGLTPLASTPDVTGERFLFIGGLHRSGTSILHRLLREHPSTSSFPGTGAPQDEGQHLQTVFPPAKPLGGPGRFAFAPQLYLTETSPLATSGNRDQLLREWGAYYDLGKAILLEKSPPNLIRSRFLQALFPGACFVFIVRHPIAVALATQKWSRTTLVELLLHWYVAHAIMLADLQHLQHYTLIRYEDFVEAPQTSLDRVCDMTGLERFTPRECVANHNDQYFARWAQSDRPSQQLLECTLGHEGGPLGLFGYAFRAPYVGPYTLGR